jgi:hypothetical protein
MSFRMSDIFTTVTRYDKPENRFTASLVYLLQELWNYCKGDQERRDAFCHFLNKLCRDEDVPWGEYINFNIQEYEKGEDGRKRILDFKIVSPDNVLVWVEVKDTAKITQDFKKDKSKLRKRAKESGCGYNRLVLLRHYYVSKEESKGVDHDARWSEFYKWLRDMADKCTFDKNSVNYFLLNHFLKHLGEKGVSMVSTINMSHVQAGLADFISLMTVVREEAKSPFDKRDLKISRVDTNFWPYEKGDYVDKFVEFSFFSGKPRGLACSIELWASEAKTIYMSLYRDYLEGIGRRVIMSRVQKGNNVYFEDEHNCVTCHESLETVFQKNSLKEQEDEIGRLLSKMFDAIWQKTVKKVKSKGRK